MSRMQDAFKRWIMLQPSHKTERLVAFEAGYQAAIADVKAGVDNRGGPGLGDDVPCSKCRAVALRYRTMRQGMPVWTADHNKALRFARRIDAEKFAEEDEDAWRIAEHAWDDLTPNG